MFNFEELDKKTRSYMLLEFKLEIESNNPYRSKNLLDGGWKMFPKIMEKAINEGNEETLAKELNNQTYWKTSGERKNKKTGKITYFKIRPEIAAKELAQTEFNTWYVRGLSKRLIDEGVKSCQVYRAAPAQNPRVECCEYEDKIFNVENVYSGHRKRYWPEPGNIEAFSIPCGPNCHHTIRRYQ